MRSILCLALFYLLLSCSQPKVDCAENDAICLIENAVSMDDINVCDLGKEDTKYFCQSQYGVKTGNFLICKKVEGDYSYRGGCYWRIMEKSPDEAKCTKLEEPYKSACYYGVARGKDDLAMCNRVNHSMYHIECIKDLAKSPLDCKPIVNHLGYFSCISRFAHKKDVCRKGPYYEDCIADSIDEVNKQ